MYGSMDRGTVTCHCYSLQLARASFDAQEAVSFSVQYFFLSLRVFGLHYCILGVSRCQGEFYFISSRSPWPDGLWADDLGFLVSLSLLLSCTLARCTRPRMIR